MIKIFKKLFRVILKKGTAVFVCTAFVFTSLSMPKVHAEISSTAALTYRSLLDDMAIFKLSKDIGKIQETYRGTTDKVVVLIQDAHSIPDAQRSIQSTIDHFQIEYGISLVGLEGASEKLDPQIFKSFPDKELLQKTFDAYAERGELTGGTAAALFNTSPVIYQGVEDWPLYEEGISYFLESTKSAPEMMTSLQPMFESLEREKEGVYSKELLELDRMLTSFSENEIDLVQVLKQLSQYQEPEKDSELAVLLKEIERKPELDTTIEIEIKKIAEKFESILKGLPTPVATSGELQEFNKNYQDFQTSRMTPQAFALYLKDGIKKHNIKVKVSRALASLVENQRKLKDIEGTQLFKEFEQYAEAVKESLFQNDEQKLLDRKTQGLALIKRLNQLELSFEDWEKIQKMIIQSDQWTVTQDGVVNQNEVSSLLKKMESHLAFYRVAEKRDAVFFKNIQAMMKRENKTTSLLVAGGFHTEGLTKTFKEKGISYVLVTPSIKALPEEPLYLQHMQGQVSWSDYFEVKNGKVNLYDAFVRATRDKLLSDKEVSANYGKAWRDQIIRDLAVSGRITQASEYTRFIDETLQSENQNKIKIERIRDAWLANIDRFDDGLKNLQMKGNLSEANIASLIKTITTGVPAELGIFTPTGAIDANLLPWLHQSLAQKSRAELRTDNNEKEVLASPYGHESNHSQVARLRNTVETNPAFILPGQQLLSQAAVTYTDFKSRQTPNKDSENVFVAQIGKEPVSIRFADDGQMVFERPVILSMADGKKAVVVGEGRIVIMPLRRDETLLTQHVLLCNTIAGIVTAQNGAPLLLMAHQKPLHDHQNEQDDEFYHPLRVKHPFGMLYQVEHEIIFRALEQLVNTGLLLSGDLVISSAVMDWTYIHRLIPAFQEKYHGFQFSLDDGDSKYGRAYTLSATPHEKGAEWAVLKWQAAALSYTIEQEMLYGDLNTAPVDFSRLDLKIDGPTNEKPLRVHAGIISRSEASATTLRSEMRDREDNPQEGQAERSEMRTTDVQSQDLTPMSDVITQEEVFRIMRNNNWDSKDSKSFVNAIRAGLVSVKVESSEDVYIVPVAEGRLDEFKVRMTKAGSGNYGRVYVISGQRGAVKLGLNNGEIYQKHIRDEESVLKSILDSQEPALKQLMEAGNLPRYLNSGNDEVAGSYLVLDMPAEARSLDKLLYLPIEDRKKILLESAKIYQILAAQGIHIYDIKAKNILVGNYGRGAIQLIDFGKTDPTYEDAEVSNFSTMVAFQLALFSDVAREKKLEQFSKAHSWPDMIAFLENLDVSPSSESELPDFPTRDELRTNESDTSGIATADTFKVHSDGLEVTPLSGTASSVRESVAKTMANHLTSFLGNGDYYADQILAELDEKGIEDRFLLLFKEIHMTLNYKKFIDFYTQQTDLSQVSPDQLRERFINSLGDIEVMRAIEYSEATLDKMKNDGLRSQNLLVNGPAGLSKAARIINGVGIGAVVRSTISINQHFPDIYNPEKERIFMSVSIVNPDEADQDLARKKATDVARQVATATVRQRLLRESESALAPLSNFDQQKFVQSLFASGKIMVVQAKVPRFYLVSQMGYGLSLQGDGILKMPPPPGVHEVIPLQIQEGKIGPNVDIYTDPYVEGLIDFIPPSAIQSVVLYPLGEGIALQSDEKNKGSITRLSKFQMGAKVDDTGRIILLDGTQGLNPEHVRWEADLSKNLDLSNSERWKAYRDLSPYNGGFDPVFIAEQFVQMERRPDDYDFDFVPVLQARGFTKDQVKEIAKNIKIGSFPSWVDYEGYFYSLNSSMLSSVRQNDLIRWLASTGDSPQGEQQDRHELRGELRFEDYESYAPYIDHNKTKVHPMDLESGGVGDKPLSDDVDNNEVAYFQKTLDWIKQKAIEIGDAEMLKHLEKFDINKQVRKGSLNANGSASIDGTNIISIHENYFDDLMNKKNADYDEIEMSFRETVIHELRHSIDFNAGRVDHRHPDMYNQYEILAIGMAAAYFDGYIQVDNIEAPKNFAAIYHYDLRKGMKSQGYTTALSSLQLSESDYEGRFSEASSLPSEQREIRMRHATPYAYTREILDRLVPPREDKLKEGKSLQRKQGDRHELRASAMDEVLSEMMQQNDGKITFRDFMETALFHEDYGYYTKKKNINEDFDTFPTLEEEAFGRGLALRYQQMWLQLGKPDKIQIVEMGAGNGNMAYSTLWHLRDLFPDLYSRVQYVIVERSEELIVTQNNTLKEFSDDERLSEDEKVNKWLRVGGDALSFNDTKGVLAEGVPRIFVSNELPDAFSVHRLKFNKKKNVFEEFYVRQNSRGKFEETFGPISSPEIQDYLDRMPEEYYETVRQKGSEMVVNLNMIKWQQNLDRYLQKGFVITIDYGHRENQYPEEKMAFRTYGKTRPYRFLFWSITNPWLIEKIRALQSSIRLSLRGKPVWFRRFVKAFNILELLFKRDATSIYRRAGEDDMTSNIDFRVLGKIGEEIGFRVESMNSQKDFFLESGLTVEAANKLEDSGFHALVQSKGLENTETSALPKISLSASDVAALQKAIEKMLQKGGDSPQRGQAARHELRTTDVQSQDLTPMPQGEQQDRHELRTDQAAEEVLESPYGHEGNHNRGIETLNTLYRLEENLAADSFKQRIDMLLVGVGRGMSALELAIKYPNLHIVAVNKQEKVWSEKKITAAMILKGYEAEKVQEALTRITLEILDMEDAAATSAQIGSQKFEYVFFESAVLQYTKDIIRVVEHFFNDYVKAEGGLFGFQFTLGPYLEGNALDHIIASQTKKMVQESFGHSADLDYSNDAVSFKYRRNSGEAVQVPLVLAESRPFITDPTIKNHAFTSIYRFQKPGASLLGQQPGRHELRYVNKHPELGEYDHDETGVRWASDGNNNRYIYGKNFLSDFSVREAVKDIRKTPAQMIEALEPINPDFARFSNQSVVSQFETSELELHTTNINADLQMQHRVQQLLDEGFIDDETFVIVTHGHFIAGTVPLAVAKDEQGNYRFDVAVYFPQGEWPEKQNNGQGVLNMQYQLWSEKFAKAKSERIANAQQKAKGKVISLFGHRGRMDWTNLRTAHIDPGRLLGSPEEFADYLKQNGLRKVVIVTEEPTIAPNLIYDIPISRLKDGLFDQENKDLHDYVETLSKLVTVHVVSGDMRGPVVFQALELAEEDVQSLVGTGAINAEEAAEFRSRIQMNKVAVTSNRVTGKTNKPSFLPLNRMRVGNDSPIVLIANWFQPKIYKQDLSLARSEIRQVYQIAIRGDRDALIGALKDVVQERTAQALRDGVDDPLNGVSADVRVQVLAEERERILAKFLQDLPAETISIGLMLDAKDNHSFLSQLVKVLQDSHLAVEVIASPDLLNGAVLRQVGSDLLQRRPTKGFSSDVMALGANSEAVPLGFDPRLRKKGMRFADTFQPLSTSMDNVDANDTLMRDHIEWLLAISLIKMAEIVSNPKSGYEKFMRKKSNELKQKIKDPADFLKAIKLAKAEYLKTQLELSFEIEAMFKADANGELSLMGSIVEAYIANEEFKKSA